MKDLKPLLEEPERRKTLVYDCVDLIDAEVKTKGLIVKGAYKVVTAIKRNIIADSVNNMLDEFVEAATPFYASYEESGAAGSLKSYFEERKDAVAEALLSVTDRRAERSSSKTMVKAYKRLRPRGKEHVMLAVPKLGALIEKHAATL